MHHISNTWTNSGRLTKGALAIYAVPVALFAISSLEAPVRAGFKSLQASLTSDPQSKADRWSLAGAQWKLCKASTLMSLVSLVPVIGTGYAYKYIIEDAANFTSNSWVKDDLQRQVNSRNADSLFQELNAWEPDVEQLLKDASEVRPATQADVDAAAKRIRGSFIGQSYVYTTGYRLIHGASKGVRIVATRTARLAARVFDGRIFRIVGHVMGTVSHAAAQEALATRDLVDQPGRITPPPYVLPTLFADCVQKIRENVEDDDESRAIEGVNQIWRRRATINALQNDPGQSVPEGAPKNYCHKAKMLPRACKNNKGADSLVNVLLGKDDGLGNYFTEIYPYLTDFDASIITERSDEAGKLSAAQLKQLLLDLSVQFANLRKLTLDFSGIDPLAQLIIVSKFGQNSRLLSEVTLKNATAQTRTIMARYTKVK